MFEPLFNIGDFTVVVWHIVAAVAVVLVLVVIIAVSCAAKKRKKAQKAAQKEASASPKEQSATPKEQPEAVVQPAPVKEDVATEPVKEEENLEEA